MAWTQAEADQVRAAILALATGARVATVSYAGPPARSVQYAPADLPQLRSLLAEMEISANSTTRVRRVKFSKGFGCG
ncbi:MAG: hypothetical protein JWL95_2919 [Gemmatimonadetes bacterium]|nr:hypothetical protein [Gemmatimonadota bacterium]